MTVRLKIKDDARDKTIQPDKKVVLHRWDLTTDARTERKRHGVLQIAYVECFI